MFSFLAILLKGILDVYLSLSQWDSHLSIFLIFYGQEREGGCIQDHVKRAPHANCCQYYHISFHSFFNCFCISFTRCFSLPFYIEGRLKLSTTVYLLHHTCSTSINISFGHSVFVAPSRRNLHFHKFGDVDFGSSSLPCLPWKNCHYTEAYSELCWTSKKEGFAKSLTASSR